MNIYSVSQVNKYIRELFAGDFLLQKLAVRGEISNCKYHSSGHIFFTLKDEASAIACVMFSSRRERLSFRLENGMKIRVIGSIDVYPRDGRYQLYVDSAEADGRGELFERFEKLKQKLKEEGLFDEEFKRKLPPYVRTLGVVTAPTGAAIRDIIQVALRRNPYLQIILYPAIVQGEHAAKSIATGIRVLSDLRVDVMIVGRGGGSIEDLWAFNEELVAQTIFTSEVPVISAVGHETDVTIADFTADFRAPTPSAAAEIAVFEYDAFAGALFDIAEQLKAGMLKRTEETRSRLDRTKRELQLLRPDGRVRDYRMMCVEVSKRMTSAMLLRLRESRHKAALIREQMKGHSPYLRLEKGYACITDDKGLRIKSTKDADIGDVLRIYLRDGQLRAGVLAKEENDGGEEENRKGNDN